MMDCLCFEQHLLNSGRNAHLVRGGEPVIDVSKGMNPVYRELPVYYKGNRFSVVGTGADIVRPRYTKFLDFELEFGVFLCRTGKDWSVEEAGDAIFGYTCVNDVTALDLLQADPSFPQWARAKSCDTFGPCGPAIATGLDWSALTVRTLLNGRERQSYPASDMILPPARIVSLLSREMTLEPGDLIASGTSIGALPMRPGMTVEVVIDGIGTLRNEVAA